VAAVSVSPVEHGRHAGAPRTYRGVFHFSLIISYHSQSFHTVLSIMPTPHWQQQAGRWQEQTEIEKPQSN
ncbi:hypothetical protein, partial [Aquabacterium sp.]|uniref:hypothetical protein n=1 Tax=Aquabacterium sp. TaxID=1872578 RepID=UPI0025C3A53A